MEDATLRITPSADAPIAQVLEGTWSLNPVRIEEVNCCIGQFVIVALINLAGAHATSWSSAATKGTTYP